MSEWTVYMIECRDGTFYTGITNELERRILAHGSGSASKYTRSRLPVKLVYRETCSDRSGALRREAAIKAMKRSAKESLIRRQSSSGRLGKAGRTR
jgi:predicted GIY-YIG superfamily endonuclease